MKLVYHMDSGQVVAHFEEGSDLPLGPSGGDLAQAARALDTAMPEVATKIGSASELTDAIGYLAKDARKKANFYARVWRGLARAGKAAYLAEKGLPHLGRLSSG